MQLSANYGLSFGQGSRTRICGYGRGKPLKDRFIRDGAGLLRTIGTQLVGQGFSPPEIIRDIGSKATAGSITARSGKANWSSSSLAITLLAEAYSFGSTRADGIALLAQVLTPTDPLGLCTESYWLNAETDTSSLSAVLADIFAAHTSSDADRFIRKRSRAHHSCVLTVRQAGPCFSPQISQSCPVAVVTFWKEGSV